MKKLLLFFVAFATIAFAGCSDDDKTPAPNNNENNNGGDDNKPVVTLKGYVEPIIEWGITEQELKNKCTFTFYKNGEDIAWFYGKDMVSLYAYQFDNYNQLKNSAAIVKNTYIESISEFLTEKYIPISANVENALIIFSNQDMSLLVCIKVFDATKSIILYMPFEESRSEQFVDEENIKSEIDILFRDFIQY